MTYRSLIPTKDEQIDLLKWWSRWTPRCLYTICEVVVQYRLTVSSRLNRILYQVVQNTFPGGLFVKFREVCSWSSGRYVREVCNFYWNRFLILKIIREIFTKKSSNLENKNPNLRENVKYLKRYCILFCCLTSWSDLLTFKMSKIKVYLFDEIANF